MNKKIKTTLGVGALLLTTVILTSCNSFCSNEDSSHFRYGYDPINTTFFETQEQAEDYIIDQVKSLEEIDDKADISISDLQIYVLNDEGTEKTLQNINDTNIDLLIKRYNDNLVYLVPNNVYVNYQSENSEVTDTTFVTVGLSGFTISLINSAITQGIITPSFSYYEELDMLTLDKMIEVSKDCGYEWIENQNLTKENITFKDIYGYTYENYLTYEENPTEENLNLLLGEDDGKGNPTRGATVANNIGLGRNYSLATTLGFLKFDNSNLDEENFDFYQQIEEWNKEISNKIGFDQVPTTSFLNLYQNTLNGQVGTIRTCIAQQDGFYGHINNDPLNSTIRIEGKAIDFWAGWGNAFTQHGPFEGLLVYPISMMIETFSHSFGMNGVGQILSVILVTFIVRGLFMLVTLPSTLSQQKLQLIQPELAKLQQRYPNFDTNDIEKQKYAQAQMALYKKHKIHPFLSLLVVFIQFPVFICVWNAMQGAASLSRDSVLGLTLSDTIWSTLTNLSGWPSIPGWWTALVLIILMSAAQILAMFIPQILNKRRLKNVPKLNVVQNQNSQQKTMKIVQWVMTIMVIFMGFTLPSAMGVYWFCGAIFSIIQTLLLHFILINREKKRK